MNDKGFLNIFSYNLSFIKRIAIVYLMFSISRIIFFTYNIKEFSDVEISDFVLMALDGLRFDTVAIVYVNILFTLLYNIPFRFRTNSLYQKVLKWIFISSNTIALYFNFADIPYYNYVYERSTFKVFSEFSHEQNKIGFALEFLKDFWGVLILFLLTIFLLYKLYDLVQFKIGNKIKSWIFYTGNTLFLLLVITLSIGGARGGFAHSTRPISVSDAGNFVKNTKQLAIVLNTPFVMMKTIDAFEYKRLNYFEKDELEKIYNPIHSPSDTAVFKNKNVVIFILESFSKEFIGSLNKDRDNGNFKGYTPFLDSLISHSLTFNTSMANGRKSIEAMPSVLASMPTINYTFTLSSYYNNNITTLPKLLREKGYYTSFFHGAPNGSMGFQAFANMIGIDDYYGKNEFNNDSEFDGMWGIWDEPFFKFYADKLNEFKQPFMSTLFSVSSHHPFKIPEKYEGKFNYDTHPIEMCISYTDFALKEFFRKASKEDWFNNTIFVFTADHVSGYQSENYKSQYGTYSVPVIFYTPDGSIKHKLSDQLAQQIDIMPSILDYLGYDQKYFAFGSSLLRDKKDKFILNYRNDVIRFLKGDYFMSTKGENVFELFNFKQDKQLQNNILSKNLEIADSLMIYQKAFLQQFQNRMIDDDLKVE